MYIERDRGRGETKGHNYERPDFHQNHLLPNPQNNPYLLVSHLKMVNNSENSILKFNAILKCCLYVFMTILD